MLEQSMRSVSIKAKNFFIVPFSFFNKLLESDSKLDASVDCADEMRLCCDRL